MKLARYLTFRKQIIIIVVLLAVMPLFFFGFYSLKIAGSSQESVDKIKNTLMIGMSREIETFFADLNRSLQFTRTFERRNTKDLGLISKVLFGELQANENIVSIAYVSNGKAAPFFGSDYREVSLEKRLEQLLKRYSEDKWIQISKAYEFEGHRVFDMLYPLETDDFVFLTISLKSIENKLSANEIEQTGVFALVSGDGVLYAGGEVAEHRLEFIQISDIIRDNDGDVVFADVKGYHIKGKKLEDLIWPFWVIFSQNIWEAKAMTRKLRFSLMSLLAIFLLFSGVTSFTLSNNFSRPIASLLEAVKKNSGGDLQAEANRHPKDSRELMLLIDEFNRMIVGLRDARKKLVEQERLAAVGEMANVIGHDIRNPLAAIKNGAYFIRHASSDGDERLTMTLDIIEREIDNIRKIVDDLLGYSRQRPPALTAVDVNVLLDEVVSLIETPENISIEKEYAQNLPEFMLDRGEIRQVLVNLVNNAVQACDKTKGVVKVLSSLNDRNELQMIVRDNGMGIPKEKLDKVFQAFFSSKEGGTGLGLASAKRIVERHEGTVNIKSKEKIGTDIIIVIPKLKKNE